LCFVIIIVVIITIPAAGRRGGGYSAEQFRPSVRAYCMSVCVCNKFAALWRGIRAVQDIIDNNDIIICLASKGTAISY